MFKYFVLASELQLILLYRWLKPSRRPYILAGLVYIVISGHLIGVHHIPIVCPILSGIPISSGLLLF